jgi:hypothetical protein
MNGHLTDDQLIDRLYGVDDSAHQCTDCADRMRAMEQKRAEHRSPVPVSADFLAAGRRAVYSRLGEQPKSRMNWVPATAAALFLVAAGVVVSHTSYRSVAPVAGPSATVSHAVSHSDAAKSQEMDAQLFSEVYAMEQSAEPRAAAPIHALIEEN